MTRLRHIFRHLSVAAKRQQDEGWRLYRRAADSEEFAAMRELNERISVLEQQHKILKKAHPGDERLINIEKRILLLKLMLLKSR